MSNQNGPGQPTKYKPEFCQKLIDHMALGYSFESFAAIAGVHRATMYDWEKEYPDFKEAKEIAFSKCLLHWEKLGVEHILNESHEEEDTESGTYKKTSKSLNTVGWIFNMKNRFKWRDKQPDEIDTVVNNNNSNTQTIDKISDDDLNRRVAELHKKLFGSNES